MAALAKHNTTKEGKTMAKLLGAKIKVKSAPKLNGVVLYEGPSVLDGAPIAVIATLKSSNVKTGDMVQTWIIRSDMHPLEALKQGADSSICGNCVHRQSTGGACYVTVHQAPAAVYRTYKAGKYPTFNLAEHAALFAGRKIRLGAYGDPAAAPYSVWQTITDLCIGHTGYTHQARHKAFDARIASLCMVSADSPRQATKYQQQGFQTFRVAMAGDSLMAGEVECLADSQGLSCLQCGLCDGRKQSVAITVHGTRAANFTTALVPAVNI